MTWPPQKAPSHSPSLSFSDCWISRVQHLWPKRKGRGSEGLYQTESCRKPRVTSVDSMCVLGPGWKECSEFIPWTLTIGNVQATISLRADELGLQWPNRLVDPLSCGPRCTRLLNRWNALTKSSTMAPLFTRNWYCCCRRVMLPTRLAPIRYELV